MNTVRYFLVGLVIFLVLTACGFSFSLGSTQEVSTPQPAGGGNSNSGKAVEATLPVDHSSPGTVVTSVTMAEDTQGEDKTPVNPTSTFKQTDTFHAVTAIKDAPTNTTFKSTWYVVDVGQAASPNTEIDSIEVVTEGTRNIDFTLSPPKNNWPTGTYRVEIYMDGKKVTEESFSVQ